MNGKQKRYVCRFPGCNKDYARSTNREYHEWSVHGHGWIKDNQISDKDNQISDKKLTKNERRNEIKMLRDEQIKKLDINLNEVYEKFPNVIKKELNEIAISRAHEKIRRQTPGEKEKDAERQRNYWINATEEQKENRKFKQREYYYTPKGHEFHIKREAKRRNLGFNPLNEHFNGSEAHHINKNDVIYIPEQIHHSIYHNQFTGQGMLKINKLAWDYLLGETVKYSPTNYTLNQFEGGDKQ